MKEFEVEYGHNSKTWFIIEMDGWLRHTLTAYDKKDRAVKAARDLAKKEQGLNKLTVKTKSGKISEQTTYRNGKPV